MSNTADEHDPDALAEALARYVFQIGMPSFNTYLETISEFLKTEAKKHLEDIDHLREQIRSGKRTPEDKPGEMPWEEQYEQHVDFLIGEIEEFENILLKSFFVTIYSFLEEHLTGRCLRVKNQDNLAVLSWSKWKKKNEGPTIKKALLYLITTQQINPSPEHSTEWKEILCYVHLRNCIVHNEGRVEDDSEKELKECISQEKSNLSLNEQNIVLTKEFCKSAWKTIEEFLWLISKAEIQSKE